jgi:hypothetical protein
MPQNPLSAGVARILGGAISLLNLDVGGNLLVTTGGKSSALDVTAAAAIKGAAGRLCKISVIAPGSAGSLTLNDAASTGAAAAANEIASIAFGSLTAGQVIALDWPCANGITVSAIPTGGAVSISYS